MRRFILMISVVLLLGCLSSCSPMEGEERRNTSDAVSIKPEGDVYLYIEKLFSEDVVQKDDDIKVKIRYGCNLALDNIQEGTTARLVISSEQVNIDDKVLVFDKVSGGEYLKESDPVYEFTFPVDAIICNVGKVKFEFQLLDATDEIYAFSNREIYFAVKDEQIYLGGNCIEEAADYVSQEHDIYYDSVQGVDFYTECFWYDESEKLLFFIREGEKDREVKQYSYEMSGKNMLIKDEKENIVFTIEYVQKDEMKINDKVFYCVDEDSW